MGEKVKGRKEAKKAPQHTAKEKKQLKNEKKHNKN